MEEKHEWRNRISSRTQSLAGKKAKHFGKVHGKTCVVSWQHVCSEKVEVSPCTCCNLIYTSVCPAVGTKDTGATYRTCIAVSICTPSSIYNLEASVPCTGCDVERDTGWEGGGDSTWRRLELNGPSVDKCSGERRRWNRGIRVWRVEFVSDVTHSRILPCTAAEIQWRVQVTNHSGSRLFCSLSAKRVANVKLNVTIYGRKGKALFYWG